MGKNVKFPIGQQVTKNTYIKHSLVSVKNIYITIFAIILKVKVAQSCLILCNPMDYTVHGILQV